MIAFLLLQIFLLGRVRGESVCDEVDVLFLIDDESILAQGGADVIEFILYLVQRESGEHAGFSVGVYGEKIPIDMDKVLLKLVDTEAVYQRASLTLSIDELLSNAFAQIVTSAEDGGGVKNVSLTEIFETLTAQPRAHRRHAKRNRICGAATDCTMGLHDDSERVFVFDYHSTLLKENNDEICGVIDFIERNDTDGEGLLIMTGTADAESTEILCNGAIPSLLEDQLHTVIEFTPNLRHDGKMMEYIGSMTCPAEIVSPQGTLNLGNHVQWVDSEIIVSCHSEFLPNNANGQPVNQLTNTSYILVRDYPEDATSFLLNDYLIADSATLQALPDDCEAVYKIVNIETQSTGEVYDTLKLSVQLPESMMEYIYEIDAEAQNVGLTSKRRLWDTVEASASEDVVDEEWGPWDWSSGDIDFEVLHAEYKPEYNYNAYLDGATGEVSSQAEYSDPTLAFGVGGILALNVSFYAKLQLAADFYFKYSAWSGDTHINLKFNGGYTLSFRIDVEFEGYLRATIAKLLQWSLRNSKVLYVGYVPVLYDPFVIMDVDVETLDFELSAGFQFEVAQDFTVGFYYDAVWNDCQTSSRYETSGCYTGCNSAVCWYDYCDGEGSDSGCWWGTRYYCKACQGGYDEDSGTIQDFGEITRSASVSASIGGDKEDDGCPDLSQNFGLNIVPQLKVGAVFYALLAVYAKPELEFPLRLTMPESDGPTCGRSSSFDLCSSQMEASWSIDMNARFYVGYHLQSINDMIDRLWTQVTQLDAIAEDVIGTWSTWLEWMDEYQIGGDLEIGTLADGCFELPDVLEAFYSEQCGCESAADPALPMIDAAKHGAQGGEFLYYHDDGLNKAAPEPQDFAPRSTPTTVFIDFSSRWVFGSVVLVVTLMIMAMIWMRCTRSDGKRKYAKVAFADSENEAQAINVEDE